MQHLLLTNVIRNAGVVTQTRRSAASASASPERRCPMPRRSRLAKMARVFPEMTSDPVSGVLPMRVSLSWSVRRWITSVTGCCST